MDADDLAYKTAVALRLEFGAALVTRTEEALQRNATAERTRQMLGDIASISVIAHFLISIAPSVLRYWRKFRSVEATTHAVLNDLKPPPGLSSETAKKVVTEAATVAMNADFQGM